MISHIYSGHGCPQLGHLWFTLIHIVSLTDARTRFRSFFWSINKLGSTRYGYRSAAREVKMESANGTEGPRPRRSSKAVGIVKSVGRFCLANWLIFAFGFAALMAYLFPRA